MPPKGIPKPKPFKPPRPSAAPKPTKSSKSAPPPRRFSKTSKGKAKETEPQNSDDEMEDDDDDPFASQEPNAEADLEREGEVEEPDVPEITIPPELLTTILHEFFTQEKGMRISKDASKAVGKYMHTFVQEALHRAAVENRENAEKNGGLGSNDVFLEVEDLEKLAPQMLLDF